MSYYILEGVSDKQDFVTEVVVSDTDIEDLTNPTTINLGKINLAVAIQGNDFTSSSVDLLVYEPTSKELGVVFSRYRKFIYLYQEISLQHFLKFFLAESKGKYFQYVKKHYSWSKMDLDEFFTTLDRRYGNNP